jgi:hypothetical protein
LLTRGNCVCAICCAAGKKAIRRKEVQVNGSVARTDMLLQEGDVVRVVMKVGSGAVWGDTAGELAAPRSGCQKTAAFGCTARLQCK